MSLRRDARNIAKTVETIEKVAAKAAPKIGQYAHESSVSFEPAGPECTRWQKAWVRETCKMAVAAGVLDEMPGLPDDLTLGQAEAILLKLGSPVDELFKMGRDWGKGKDQKAWMAAR